MALAVEGCPGDNFVRGIAGHTALGELDVWASNQAGGHRPGLWTCWLWHRVVGTLPQLSSLVYTITAYNLSVPYAAAATELVFGEADVLFDVVAALAHCPWLTRLEVASVGFKQVHPRGLLQCIGDAAGGRLETLAMPWGQLSREGGGCWDEELCAALPALYPHLEVLELSVVPPSCCEQQEFEARLLEFARSLAAPLRALPAQRRLTLRADAEMAPAAQEPVRACFAGLCPNKRVEFHSEDFRSSYPSDGPDYNYYDYFPSDDEYY